MKLNFLKNAWTKLKSFVVKVDDFVEKNAIVAVNFTNALKAVVNSPAMDLVVEFTPTNVDNIMLPKVREVVGQVATEMGIAYQLFSDVQGQTLTYEQKIAKVVEYLKSILPGARVGFIVDFCGRLTMNLSDGKLSLAEAIARSQDIYNELFIKKAA